MDRREIRKAGEGMRKSEIRDKEKWEKKDGEMRNSVQNTRQKKKGNASRGSIKL